MGVGANMNTCLGAPLTLNEGVSMSKPPYRPLASPNPHPQLEADKLGEILENWLDEAFATSSLGVTIDDTRTDEDREKQYDQALNKAKSALNLYIRGREREADEYFVLLAERKKLKDARREFMQTYKCLSPHVHDSYEPPVDCIQWVRADHRHTGWGMCYPCKNRQHFYLALKANAIARGVIARKRIKQLQEEE